MRLFGIEITRHRILATASCPACGCELVNRQLTAWRLAGDGQRTYADKAGETVRCCACSCSFTVGNDGKVLGARMKPAPPPRADGRPADRGARDGRAVGVDEDLDTLDAQFPPL
jgi:hypothetical protein